MREQGNHPFLQGCCEVKWPHHGLVVCWPLPLHIGGPEMVLVPKLGAVLVSLWGAQSAGLCFFLVCVLLEVTLVV